jgi:uncharacterized membrane protein YfcA
MLALLFGTLSLLYATVGQAGGTAFLALMAFASFPSSEMRPTALLLNIVAASYLTWLFNRGSLVDWAKLKPLLIASLPTALVGGFIVSASTKPSPAWFSCWPRQSSPCAKRVMENRISQPRYGARSA